MTKQELLKILDNDCDGDLEKAHKNSDEALLEYLNDAEITVAFDSVDKWYA